MNRQRAIAQADELLVSVVVPVRDQAAHLSGLLDALARQTLPRGRFEVLIGDDGSRDDPARALRPHHGSVRLLSAEPRNSYAARNRAARAARAPALAFTDADCRPNPNWLEAGLAGLARADLVVGEFRLRVPERPTAWTLVDLERRPRRNVEAGQVATSNLFVHRELFDRLHGFDETLPSGGDWEFGRRCLAHGARLSFCSDAVVLHPTVDQAGALLRKVWFRHRSGGARVRRSRRPPRASEAFFRVPVLGPIARRRSLGVPLTLDRRGLVLRRGDALQAVVGVYVLVPSVALAASLYGWVVGVPGRVSRTARRASTS